MPRGDQFSKCPVIEEESPAVPGLSSRKLFVVFLKESSWGRPLTREKLDRFYPKFTEEVAPRFSIVKFDPLGVPVLFIDSDGFFAAFFLGARVNELEIAVDLNLPWTLTS